MYSKVIKESSKNQHVSKLVLDNFGSLLVSHKFYMSTSTCLFFQFHLTLRFQLKSLTFVLGLECLHGVLMDRMWNDYFKPWSNSLQAYESWTIDLRHWKLVPWNWETYKSSIVINSHCSFINMGWLHRTRILVVNLDLFHRNLLGMLRGWLWLVSWVGFQTNGASKYSLAHLNYSFV